MRTEMSSVHSKYHNSFPFSVYLPILVVQEVSNPSQNGVVEVEVTRLDPQAVHQETEMNPCLAANLALVPEALKVAPPELPRCAVEHYLCVDPQYAHHRDGSSTLRA